ncbi:MAG TPA: HupE/UreJ family protein [Xanthobacteraceae bacterium]|jgi:urease accessory protein|nr:HupE/UreJ family protein [Xanthobacteraceae bacterium]
MNRILLRLSAVAMAMFPTIASAHPGLGPHQDFVHGFMHPLSGLDHILTMVAVGLIAAHLGGRAMVLVPAAFVGAMSLAGLAGMAGINLPFVEIGIALSVIVLGAAVALRVQLPLVATMAIVGFFAIFHGHAHGTEMPATASGLLYGSGFVLATALLHAVGIGLGLLVGFAGRANARVMQFGGGAMVLAGVALLFGAI